MAFDRAKRELLNGLNSGVDSSPKGSLDEPIYDLGKFSYVNKCPNLTKRDVISQVVERP